MNISETTIDDQLIGHFREAAAAGAAIVGVEPNKATAEEVIRAIDRWIGDWQKGHRPEVPAGEDLSVVLGALWGDQLCRALGWEWSAVVFRNPDIAVADGAAAEGTRAVGVFSPDRSLAIYPFHFVYGCLENQAPVTIDLAYQILVAGTRVPKLPPGGFENVMDHVHPSAPMD